MGKYDAGQRQRIWSDLMIQAKEHKSPQAKAQLGDAYFHGWHAGKLKRWLSATGQKPRRKES